MSFRNTQFVGSSHAPNRRKVNVKETTRTWASFRFPGTPAPVEETPVEEAPTVPAARATSGTFIELGAMFEGTLKLSGDFRIDNEFRGELTTDGTVVVGPGGSIEGNIIARQVEIEGAVVGNVTAKRMCILRASGRLHGDVETACIEIERHAFFQGATRMLHPIANAGTSIAHTATV